MILVIKSQLVMEECLDLTPKYDNWLNIWGRFWPTLYIIVDSDCEVRVYFNAPYIHYTQVSLSSR